MDELLDGLRGQYPALTFVTGDNYHWSPAEQTITYRFDPALAEMCHWSLLHEVGHADLAHVTYSTDFELIQLEVEAWCRARQIATEFDISIDPEHIQDCLDTYRDWLHRRSTCPQCGTVSIQQDATHYECFNCHCTWQVSTSRFCRPYRLIGRSHKKKRAPAVRGTFH